MNTQERTNRDTGLENIVESMYTEDCGQIHASAKRKKKVKEAGIDPETGEDQSDAKHDYSGEKWMVQWTKNIKAKLAKAQEIGDSKEANKLQRFDNHDVKRPTGATDCKHCGGDGKHDDGSECPKCKGKGWHRAPVQPSSPARLSQSPHRPSGMSGPGMMP